MDVGMKVASYKCFRAIFDASCKNHVGSQIYNLFTVNALILIKGWTLYFLLQAQATPLAGR